MAPPVTNYETLAVSSRFSIHIKHPNQDTFSHETEKWVNSIWDKEKRKRGDVLYEGKIFHALSYSSKKLVGCFIPYKYFFAQVCEPKLYHTLKIVPVSVSGLTMSRDHILIGKRASWVAQNSDRLELIPSGGIRPPEAEMDQKIHLKQQILAELSEEAHIPLSSVKSVQFFSLIKDLKNGAIELIAEISLKSKTCFSTSNEYNFVMTVPKSEIQAFAKAHLDDFVPLSLHILRLRNFL